MNLDLDVTEIFEKNMQSDKEIVINRGGTRSSKTHSLAQLFILRMTSQFKKKFLLPVKHFRLYGYLL